MTASLATNLGSTSDPDRYVGMSDEEEIRRHGISGEGLGEVLIDYSEDFKALGLTDL